MIKCRKCGRYNSFKMISALMHNGEYTATYRCRCGNEKEVRMTEDYLKKELEK